MDPEPARNTAARLTVTARSLARVWWLPLAGLVLYFAVMAALGWRCLEFGDETEKLVGVLMVQDGKRLYRDVFAHHGPLAYLLPHALASVFGAEAIRNSRVILAATAVGAAAAIAWSPLLEGVRARALTFATFLGALAPIWILGGLHFTLYQNLAGAAAAVVLAQVAVPSLLGARIGRRAALVGGIGAGLMPFAAYAYGPAAALSGLAAGLGVLAAPGGRRRLLPVAGWFTVGALVSAGAVMLWLAAFGDVRGFFVYHYHLNQTVFARYIGYGWTNVFRSLEPSFAPWLLTRAVAVVATLAALGAAFAVTWPRAAARPKAAHRRQAITWPRAAARPKAAHRRQAITWPRAAARPKAAHRRQAIAVARREGRILRGAGFAVLVTGFLFLNPRGGFGFAANAMILAGLAVAAVVAGWLFGGASTPASPGRRAIALALAAGVVLAMEAASHVAPSSPHGLPREALGARATSFGVSDAPLATLVRELADPHEPVEALVFRPLFYLETGRRPASAHYYYFPWQAQYERSPWNGYRIDLCEDLRVRAPPVVYFDDWLVWDRYRFAEYAPCVARLLEDAYVAVAIDPNLRVRRDRLVERWRPTALLVAASAADREALASRLAGVRRIALELRARPGSCLAAAPHAGQPLAIKPCGTDVARWDAIASPDGVALVTGSPASCADALGSSRAQGAAVVAAACHGGSSQLVDVEATGGGVNLRFRHSGLCLVADATGQAARQERCPHRGEWVEFSAPAAAASGRRNTRPRRRAAPRGRRPTVAAQQARSRAR